MKIKKSALKELRSKLEDAKPYRLRDSYDSGQDDGLCIAINLLDELIGED